MEILSSQVRFNFLKRKQLAFIFSCGLVIISIGFLFSKGLNFGIDFIGGTLIEVRYKDPITIESIHAALQESDLDRGAIVQYFGSSHDVLMRFPMNISGDPNKAAEMSSHVTKSLRKPFNEILVNETHSATQKCVSNGTIENCHVQIQRIEFVGPRVGNELTNQGGLAILYALIAILMYVTYRFDLRFAIGSVLAIIHDVLITIGVFSIFQFEFSLSVLAAILAVIGYSLNDTIVVYDRIRENLTKISRKSVSIVMNESINQTLPRTILTSLTTLLVIVALLIFGGESIRYFSIALLIGVIVGTYSSIFLASIVVLQFLITKQNIIQIKDG